MNRELPDVQAGFRKGRGTRDQIANICWIIKKAREFQKTSISALLTIPKPLAVWITINCGKFWKRWEYQTTWPAWWEICMQVRKQQNWTWNNRLVPNWKRSTSKLYIVTLLIYLICRVHHEKRWAEGSTAGINIALGNINNLRYADDTTLMAESEELKNLLIKVKEESKKVGLKLNIQKTKILASSPIHFMANRWGISGNSERLYFGGLQNHYRWWLQPWI